MAKSDMLKNIDRWKREEMFKDCMVNFIIPAFAGFLIAGFMICLVIISR